MLEDISSRKAEHDFFLNCFKIDLFRRDLLENLFDIRGTHLSAGKRGKLAKIVITLR